MINGFIASKQRELDAHPLLDELRRDEPGVAEALAPRLSFPVAELEDVVRRVQGAVREAARFLELREAMAMVERYYDAMWRTLDDLEEGIAERRMTAAAAAPSRVRWRGQLGFAQIR